MHNVGLMLYWTGHSHKNTHVPHWKLNSTMRTQAVQYEYISGTRARTRAHIYTCILLNDKLNFICWHSLERIICFSLSISLPSEWLHKYYALRTLSYPLVWWVLFDCFCFSNCSSNRRFIEMKVDGDCDGDAIDIDRFDTQTYWMLFYIRNNGTFSQLCIQIFMETEVLKTVIGAWSNAFNGIQNNLSSMCNCIISFDLIDFFNFFSLSSQWLATFSVITLVISLI